MFPFHVGITEWGDYKHLGRWLPTGRYAEQPYGVTIIITTDSPDAVNLIVAAGDIGVGVDLIVGGVIDFQH
jgi:hypothetical protein